MKTRTLPFTVYPTKTKTLLLFLLSAIFVAGGIFLIHEGEARVGWLCTGFFGLGIPIFLAQLHPKSSFLTVSDQGIEFASLFRKTEMKWSEIGGFGTYTMRQKGLPIGTYVGINYSAEFYRAQKARALSKALVGFEGALPDTYGFRAEELAQLLASYHRKYCGANS